MQKTFLVKNDFIDSRVDRWFRKNVCAVPQSLIEKYLRKGKIKINNKRTKSSQKLKKNDLIFVDNLNLTPDKNKTSRKKYIATKSELSQSSGMFIENNEN